MKRYPVSKARERLSELLDEADLRGAVVIERRDVQYVVTARPSKPRARKTKPVIEVLDPSITEGQWGWTWTPDGVAFQGTRPRS